MSGEILVVDYITMCSMSVLWQPTSNVEQHKPVSTRCLQCPCLSKQIGEWQERLGLRNVGVLHRCFRSLICCYMMFRQL